MERSNATEQDEDHSLAGVNMEENYIVILIQSLEKKVKILKEISQENATQKQVLQAEELDMEVFQKTVDKKNELIQQIEFLDSGFEKMYQRVKDILNQQKKEYQNEIAELKRLISEITDLTVRIQSEERANRNLAEVQFGKEKKKIRQVNASKSAASKYYQNMSKLSVIEPQFMDKKK